MDYPTKNKVAAAGKLLAAANSPDEEPAEALEVLSMWRIAHQAPLEAVASDVAQVVRDIPEAVIATRLKRHDTIIRKLRRDNANFKLSQLDDIAGCRIIVPRMREVRTVENRLHSIGGYWKQKDYIDEPKKSGYRSLHLFFRRDNLECGYNALRIEVQVRSSLQHAWSTAVESYDLINSKGLKFGEAPNDAKRFFLLTSQLIALKEGEKLAPEAPGDLRSIESELSSLERSTHIFQKLGAFSGSVELAAGIEEFAESRYLLVKYDSGSNMAWASLYDDAEQAVWDYSRAERDVGQGQDVLLANTSSIENLRAAYPNYFSDLRGFLSAVRPHMGNDVSFAG